MLTGGTLLRAIGFLVICAGWFIMFVDMKEKLECDYSDAVASCNLPAAYWSTEAIRLNANSTDQEKINILEQAHLAKIDVEIDVQLRQVAREAAKITELVQTFATSCGATIGGAIDLWKGRTALYRQTELNSVSSRYNVTRYDLDAHHNAFCSRIGQCTAGSWVCGTGSSPDGQCPATTCDWKVSCADADTATRCPTQCGSATTTTTTTTTTSTVTTTLYAGLGVCKVLVNLMLGKPTVDFANSSTGSIISNGGLGHFQYLFEATAGQSVMVSCADLRLGSNNSCGYTGQANFTCTSGMSPPGDFGGTVQYDLSQCRTNHAAMENCKTLRLADIVSRETAEVAVITNRWTAQNTSYESARSQGLAQITADITYFDTHSKLSLVNATATRASFTVLDTQVAAMAQAKRQEVASQYAARKEAVGERYKVGCANGQPGVLTSSSLVSGSALNNINAWPAVASASEGPSSTARTPCLEMPCYVGPDAPATVPPCSAARGTLNISGDIDLPRDNLTTTPLLNCIAEANTVATAYQTWKASAEEAAFRQSLEVEAYNRQSAVMQTAYQTAMAFARSHSNFVHERVDVQACLSGTLAADGMLAIHSGFDSYSRLYACKMHDCPASKCLVTKQPCDLGADSPAHGASYECVDRVEVSQEKLSYLLIGLGFLLVGCVPFIFARCMAVGEGPRNPKISPDV